MAAQTAGTASLSGTVHDTQQHPCAGVVLTLRLNPTSSPITARTNGEGKYHFASVPPRTYQLRADGGVSGSATYGPLELRANDARTVNLTLTTVSSSQAPGFSDEPNFTVAGVSQTSGAGGHGSDAVRRKTEDLTKETAALGESSTSVPPNANAATAADDRVTADLRRRIAEADTADLHHQLAAVEERSGHPLDAVREYQRAAQMDPTEANLFDWGAELLTHRATEPAIEVFTKGTKLYPHSVRMMTALGVAEFARGSYDLAAARLCQASDLSPRDRAPYLFLGKIQNMVNGNPQAVLVRLERFSQLYPEDAQANYYYALALWRQRGNDSDQKTLVQTQALLQKAVRQDPKFAPAYLQLGILYASHEQFSDAIREYQQAISADPNLEEAHYRLGQAYRRTGDTQKADEQLRIYQNFSKSNDERIDRERKSVLQFVYELKAPPPAEHAQ